jgi:hypothetical protein
MAANIKKLVYISKKFNIDKQLISANWGYSALINFQISSSFFYLLFI